MNVAFHSGRPGKITSLFIWWSCLGMVLGLSLLFSRFQSRAVINLVYLEFSKTMLSDSVRMSRLDGVEYRFESLLQSDRGDDSIWAGLAQIAIRVGDLAGAEDYVDRVQDSGRREIGLYELGWKFYEQKDYLRAARYWKQIAPTLSDLSWDIVLSAEEAAAQQEWNMAVSLYLAALEVGFDNPVDAALEHLKVARILEKQLKDYAAAEKHLIDAIRLDPSRMTHYQVYLAYNYWDSGQWNKARGVLEQVVLVAPGDGAAYAALAYTYVNLQEWEQAAEAASRSVELNAEDPWAYSLNGTIARHWGRYSQALIYSQRAVSLAPDEVQYQVELGDTYSLLGENALALETFQRALNMESDGPWSHALRARIQALTP